MVSDKSRLCGVITCSDVVWGDAQNYQYSIVCSVDDTPSGRFGRTSKMTELNNCAYCILAHSQGYICSEQDIVLLRKQALVLVRKPDIALVQKHGKTRHRFCSKTGSCFCSRTEYCSCSDNQTWSLLTNTCHCSCSWPGRCSCSERRQFPV